MRIYRHDQPSGLILRTQAEAEGSCRSKLAKIDIDGLAEDREQFFAEAVHLYRLGEQWWPTRAFELEHMKTEQEARYEADVWQELIASYLANQERVTVGQVAREAIFIDSAKIGTADQRRISAAMEMLGWNRLPKDRQGNRWWSPMTADGT